MSIVKNIELRMAIDRALTGGGAAGEWRLDPAGSGVWFRAKVFGGLRSAGGTFRSVTGDGRVSAEGLINGKVVIRTASVATGNTAWDARLRSRSLLDAERNPDLTVTVTSADRIGNGRLLLTAGLTVADLLVPLVMDAEVIMLDDTDAQLRADIVLARADLGLGRRRFGLIGRKVHVHVNVHFTRSESAGAGFGAAAASGATIG
ncbi:MAG TPA: YceI family protein [Actinocrinis sp.]|nr:YceI family protein [Actinocrinis sp.]